MIFPVETQGKMKEIIFIKWKNLLLNYCRLDPLNVNFQIKKGFLFDSA
jgi:hypothetical protein